jgi:hypothetical protein
MRASEDPGHPYSPFHLKTEYGLVDYLTSHNLGQADIDDFLSSSFVSIRIYTLYQLGTYAYCCAL